MFWQLNLYDNNCTLLQESYNWTQSELHKTEENLSASLHNISTLEKTLVMSSEKYVYMQKLRDYIAVLCDFLKV